jgi:deazaflavin-dependent oxidoreductase (nitroreductase family)
MTTRNDSPNPSTAELPRVDPPARVSPAVRVYAAFLATSLGTWIAKNVAPKLDPWLLRTTGGRLSMGLMLPSALLTTTGAKTGQSRTNPVFYFHDGPDVIVIASNYGSDRNPTWYHNLRANPRAQLSTNGGGPLLTATEVCDPIERERLFAMADRVYPSGLSTAAAPRGAIAPFRSCDFVSPRRNRHNASPAAATPPLVATGNTVVRLAASRAARGREGMHPVMA